MSQSLRMESSRDSGVRERTAEDRQGGARPRDRGARGGEAQGVQETAQAGQALTQAFADALLVAGERWGGSIKVEITEGEFGRYATHGRALYVVDRLRANGVPAELSAPIGGHPIVTRGKLDIGPLSHGRAGQEWRWYPLWTKEMDLLAQALEKA